MNDILCVCETWFSVDQVSDAELSLENKYHVFRRDRPTERKGGILIFVKKMLTAAQLKAGVSSELMCVDVIGNPLLRLICVNILLVYWICVSPKWGHEDFGS